MKIRTDFVTNSSSSSYIIAYSNRKNFFDKETLNKYPIMEYFQEYLLSIFKKSNSYYDEGVEFITNLDDLDEYVDSDTKNKISEYLNKGFTIIEREIDYNNLEDKNKLKLFAKSYPDDLIIITSDY